MTHDWKLIETTKFDKCKEGEMNNSYYDIRKCSRCGEEHRTDHDPSVSTMFVGGGECTGIYPIKVRIV